MTTPEPLPLGPLLQRLRTAAALSQEALAERAGLSVRAVSDLERGLRLAPRLETVRLLADALHLGEVDRAALIAAARPDLAPPLSPPSGNASPRTAVPVSPTRLIGRTQDVETLDAFLRSGVGRLVTLTGPGGVGKTRLALAAAEVAASHFADGAVLVNLAPVRDPAIVPTAVVAALGIRGAGTQTLGDQLAAYLRPRSLLLVLDNCEQVLESAPFVAELLATAPGLSVLATSREPLRLSGEHVMPVHPLATDVPRPPTDDAPRLSDAVTLFVERAHAADPGFALTPENAAHITGIVAQLNGLPLAIELAAARARTLPPAALLERLRQHSLRLLTGGPRDLPDRQRTMRDAIGWSYDLLAPADQRLLRTLAVFVGGFTLEAATAVAAPAGDELVVLDGVSSLVDKSLVRRVGGFDTEPRFAILETIREYGLEALAAHDEETAARDAHATWALALAQQAGPELLGPGQARWLKQLDAELPNLRAAVDHLELRGSVLPRLQVANAIWPFWYFRGHLNEGRSWLSQALAGEEDTPRSLRSGALFAAALLAFGQTDYEQALAYAEESLMTAQSMADEHGVALALSMRGMLMEMFGEYELGLTRLEEALRLWRKRSNRFWAGIVLLELGEAAAEVPDLERATAYHEEAVSALRDVGTPWSLALATSCLGLVILARGDADRAEQLFRDSIANFSVIDDQWFVCHPLAGLAMVAERAAQPARAARLIGVVDAVCHAVASSLLQSPGEAARYAATISATRAQLGDTAYAAAHAAGRALPLAAAIHEVLAGHDGAAHEPVSPASTRGDSPV